MTPVHCWSRQPGPHTALIDTPKRQPFSRASSRSLNRTDVDLAVLRAHAALAERRIEAIALGNSQRRSPKSKAASTSPVRPCCWSVSLEETPPDLGHPAGLIRAEVVLTR